MSYTQKYEQRVGVHQHAHHHGSSSDTNGHYPDAFTFSDAEIEEMLMGAASQTPPRQSLNGYAKTSVPRMSSPSTPPSLARGTVSSYIAADSHNSIHSLYNPPSRTTSRSPVQKANPFRNASVSGAVARDRSERLPSRSSETPAPARQVFHLQHHSTSHNPPPHLRQSRKAFTSPVSVRQGPPSERRQRGSGQSSPEAPSSSRHGASTERQGGDAAPPSSTAFSNRLRSMLATRQQMELLVRKQRNDEEELAMMVARMEEQTPKLPPSVKLPSSFSQSPSPRQPPVSGSGNVVDRQLYDRILDERQTAFVALRQLKEKGNAIVQKLYHTIKTQQEHTLELAATVEALKRSNARLRSAPPTPRPATPAHGGGAEDDATNDRHTAEDCDGTTVAELQRKVAKQRRVIDEMDKLMQSADSMLVAMRCRVEAAEQRASVNGRGHSVKRDLKTSTSPSLSLVEWQSLSPRGGVVSSAMAVDSNGQTTMQRLTERYSRDDDVQKAAVHQQQLLRCITEMWGELKEERAQRLRLEEVFGFTFSETERNVSLLEERLQRAETPRGLVHNCTILRQEMRALLDQEAFSANRSTEASTPTSRSAATPVAATSQKSNSPVPPELFSPTPAPRTPVESTVSRSRSNTTKQRQSSERSADWAAAVARATANGDYGDSHEVPLDVPTPPMLNQAKSLERSTRSCSSNASHRFVNFRPASSPTRARSRRPLSDGDVSEGRNWSENSSPAMARPIPVTDGAAEKDATSSFLVQASQTVDSQSIAREQAWQQRMDELDKLERDVGNVVQSLATSSYSPKGS